VGEKVCTVASGSGGHTVSSSITTTTFGEEEKCDAGPYTVGISKGLILEIGNIPSCNYSAVQRREIPGIPYHRALDVDC